MIREYPLSITVNSSGDSTDYIDSVEAGKLYAVAVNEGDLAGNFDITISYKNEQTDFVTLLTLTNLSADKTYYPREIVHSEAGEALTGTAGGDRAMPIVAGRVRVVTGDGGVSKSGGIILYVEV